MQYQRDWCRYLMYIQTLLCFHHFFFFFYQSHIYFPPLSLSVCTFTLFHYLSLPLSLSFSLCLAGLIECLNKLINHWHWWKTDRSGEVMFIKLPPICFFNPCSHLFAEYAHSFFLPWDLFAMVKVNCTQAHSLFMILHSEVFFLLLYSQYPGALIKKW